VLAVLVMAVADNTISAFLVWAGWRSGDAIDVRHVRVILAGASQL
jgi:hypothetical protein